jgi:hypothetical protein
VSYFDDDQVCGVQDATALFESFFIDYVNHMNDEERKQYLESEEVNALVEANAIGRRTIVRLSKQDDYNRRITLAAMQKAKEQNSADWKRLKKAHELKKLAIANIVKRYGNNVKRDVVKAQKAIMKTNPRYYSKTNFNS